MFSINYTILNECKNEMYTKHADGFYVRAKPNSCTPDITIKYISRYLGRPVIATSRIDKYDGNNVTFHYTRHEDDKTIEECISPEKHKILQSLLDWRNSILLSFGYDPLHCPKCKTSMLVLEVYHKKTALLNDIERLWDMDNSMFIIILSL